MSGWRSTAILGSVLLALAAYFYFFETGKEEEEKPELVFEFTAEAVTRIKISASGETTTLEKAPLEGWQIVSPIAYPADPEAIGPVISEFASLSPARTVADSVSNLSEYGLDPPQGTVEMSASLASTMTLLLGEINPTGSSYYAAARGSGRVFLISRETHTALSKTTNALRDRRLVHINQDKVDEFTVEAGNFTLNCRLDSLGLWRVVKPFDAPAERNEAVSLVGNVASMVALEYVDDHPSSLASYGLDRPVAQATVKARDGSINHTVYLGRTEGDRIYARSSERPTVYKISSHMLDQIRREPELFRRKTIFTFRSYEVPKLEIQLGPEKVSLVKRSFDDWRMMEPIETRADDKSITAVLDSLEVMKVKDFIPVSSANLKRYGLDPAPIRLTMTVDQRSVPQELLVGSLSEDGREMYVRDPHEQFIYAVNSTGLRHIPPTALDFRDRKVLRFKGYEAHVFEVIKPDLRVRMRRDQKEKTVWHLEEPTNRQADAVSVGRAFALLDTLFTEAFITGDKDADLARFGLDRPQMEIVLQIGGRDDVPEERLALLVGRFFPGDNRLVYIKRRDSPVVSLVKADFINQLNIMIANTIKS